MCLKLLLNLTFLVSVYQMSPKIEIVKPKVIEKVYAHTEIPKLPTKKEYEKTLKDYTFFKDNFSNPELYKELTWDNKERKIRFSELTELEKQQFYLLQGIKLEKHLYILDSKWDNEIGWLISGQITNLPEERNIPEEVKEYKKDLLKLRKESYKKVNDYFKKFIEKNKDNFSKEELSFLKKEFTKFQEQIKWTKKNESQSVPED